MAYYFLFPEKDTTLYSHPSRNLLNAGHDEIIEIAKEKGSTNDLYYPTRILIKFKNDEIKDTVNDVVGLANFLTKTTCSLQLLSTEHKNLTTTLNLQTFALSQSWDEGSGRYSNIPTSSNGASWIYLNNDTDKTLWVSGSSVLGTTFGSSSLWLKELPSASAHQLTINGIDFIPVLSSSIFGNTGDNNKEVYVNIGATTQSFATNLVTAINASSSLTKVSATWATASYGAPVLVLSGSEKGTNFNVTVTTSSIYGVGSGTSETSQSIFIGAKVHTSPITTGSISFDLQGGTDTGTGTFVPGSTGSINSTQIEEGGGVWYTGSAFQSSQQFLNGDNLDTNFDVTTIVTKHYNHINSDSAYPTGVPNHGILIKQPDAIEENLSSSFGEMKYFSSNTHTIYPPRLIFKWDDSTHTYQSSAKNSGELNVSLYRNKEEYNKNDIATFRIHVRDKYPTRQFASSSNFVNAGYFTTSSYYSVRDAHTEEEIIPFDDNCTKMSADSEGMYFKLYMKGLQPERYYRLLFKHKNSEGTAIYDNNYHFKIIR